MTWIGLTKKGVAVIRPDEWNLLIDALDDLKNDVDTIIQMFRYITIFVDNSLDQDVSITIKGNREPALAKSVNILSAFTVAENSTYAKTLTPENSTYLPYITVSVSCSTAPTSGYLNIYRIRPDLTEDKIVDNLAIRDTNVHDNSTDPAFIKIIQW
jgi:hypothetical protein